VIRILHRGIACYTTACHVGRHGMCDTIMLCVEKLWGIDESDYDKQPVVNQSASQAA